MDVAIELHCRLAVVNRQGGIIVDFSCGTITVRDMSNKSTPSEEPFIIVRTSSNKTGTRYNVIGNIEGLFTGFLNEGWATIGLKEPNCNIIITKADPKKLTEFIVHIMGQLPKDSPVHVSKAAFELPICQFKLHLVCQEEYVFRMENILRRNTNLDYFTELEIRNSILELAGYQVPFAGAIRKMKNLTTFRLERIKLHSSTFLEIKSRELKQLYLCWCKTQLPIASLFKNDLCYKDSLVELRLEANRWSKIPNGIFQFRNLLKLSLSKNHITELPDKFTNLPKLEELSLSNNRLERVPSSIFALQNLLRLSLSDNCVTELPDMFTNLPKLQELRFSSNELTHLPPSIFQCQNLLKLSLTNNEITELPDMFTNLPKLETLELDNNQLRSVPSSIFALQNLSVLSLRQNSITELPDKFTNLSKLKYLLLSINRLKYLPQSICSLDLMQLDVANNDFNFKIPPSVGSELIVHSLKELSYRAILNHKLIVEEGMLPKKFLNDLDNYRQCVCGRKFVDEGRDLFHVCHLKNISRFNNDNHHRHVKVAIRGQMCTSFESCFLHYLH